jgi:hypothetical protein
MRFDVYEVARDAAPPCQKPSRALAVLADAALWQAAEFVAARIAERSADDVWAELRRFTGMDEIWGPSTDPWPNDSLLFATDHGRALRVYASDQPACSFCGRIHRDGPAELCPPARDQYDRAERWSDELGLTEPGRIATSPPVRSSRTASSTLARAMAERTVVQVLRIEEPAPGEGRRDVIVRWSDGSTSCALSYFADEILVSEGDMVGKTAAELRSLHFRRDREYLQRDD